jgi:hypothetical protein
MILFRSCQERFLLALLQTLREDTIDEIMSQPFETQAAILVADRSQAILRIAELGARDLIVLLLENRVEELHHALGSSLESLSVNEELYGFWRGVWISLDLEGRQNLRANAISISWSPPEP